MDCVCEMACTAVTDATARSARARRCARALRGVRRYRTPTMFTLGFVDTMQDTLSEQGTTPEIRDGRRDTHTGDNSTTRDKKKDNSDQK